MATHQALYVHAAQSGCHLVATDLFSQSACFFSLGVIGSLANEIALPSLSNAGFLSPFSLQSS
ncbi:hypothetical protein [Acinetobacter sp. MB5]|uniref:hypothetical protein n=1 Tax=Acinetobacter sp. MB5 TaxID=2069438 RepID=UPI000DD0EA32|nr:hypothetical protein [Acinetobacter sp. MB5]